MQKLLIFQSLWGMERLLTRELGPKPYTISGPDDWDQTDRWMEALLLRERVRPRWEPRQPPV